MNDPLNEPPTQAEIDAAQRFGVSVDSYRQFKHNAGPAGAKLEQGEGPADIVAEEQRYQNMRIEPGLLKGRNEAPNLLVTAARAPGEVAQMLLFILCYILFMFGTLWFLGAERVKQIPGIFEMVYLGVLVIPAMLLTSFLWRIVGEGVRDVLRFLVRFWPLTLIALLFGLGLLKMFLQRMAGH